MILNKGNTEDYMNFLTIKSDGEWTVLNPAHFTDIRVSPLDDGRASVCVSWLNNYQLSFILPMVDVETLIQELSPRLSYTVEHAVWKKL